jgi:hypothetical protein
VRLADVSIRRPVFAVMLVGGLIVLGIVSLPRLGVDLFPRVEMPIVTVVTPLDGGARDGRARGDAVLESRSTPSRDPFARASRPTRCR